VLRWLSDPDWLEINGTRRTWFMQKMDELELPESVPGLIWIIEHEENNRGWAARTLAHYKDPRAIPALKKALAQESDYHIQHIIQCLLASGGLSDDEQLAALEAYANMISAPEGRAEVRRYRRSGDAPLNTQVAIGQYIARQNEVSEGLASRALARAESLQSKAPAVARELLALAQGWQSRMVESDMLRRIGAGLADAETIVRALERRKRLRESVRRELLDLAGSGGAAPGTRIIKTANRSARKSLNSICWTWRRAGRKKSRVNLRPCCRKAGARCNLRAPRSNTGRRSPTAKRTGPASDATIRETSLFKRRSTYSS
jgi:hypothetical protein